MALPPSNSNGSKWMFVGDALQKDVIILVVTGEASRSIGSSSIETPKYKRTAGLEPPIKEIPQENLYTWRHIYIYIYKYI